MVMALRNGVLPKTLHVDEPSPHVDWDAGDVELLTEAVEWPAGDRPRRAGVSSFGISGTNAHVIVEEAPAEAAPSAAPDTPAAPAPDTPDAPDAPAATPTLAAIPWVLSAKSEVALRAQAERLAERVRRDGADALDVGLSLAGGRARMGRRAVAVGADRDSLLAGLDALAAGASAAGVVDGAVAGKRLAILFTGQGSQRVGMGSELYRAYPVFAAAFDAACAALDAELAGHVDSSVRAVVFGEGDGERDREELLSQTVFTQAGLFAVEVALFRLVESLGVRPGFLAGHSVGELVAAHVAGVLSLADATRLVAARGRLMQALPAGGAMVALEGSEEEVAALLADGYEQVSIAAVNGPGSVVVSGDQGLVAELAATWEGRERRVRRLAVSHAFHSALMEPMLDEFAAALESLDFSEPRIPVVSNVTGELAGAEIATAGYWVRHAREAVRFMDGVRTLVAHDVGSFLELGPDGVLTAMAQGCLPTGDDSEAGRASTLATALRDGRPEPETLLTALAEIHVSGAEVDWAALFAGAAAKRVPLPTYAFQRRRYWLEVVPEAGDLTAAGQAPADHPLLSAVVALPGDQGRVLTGRISAETHPWLRDRSVLDAVVLPGAVFLELLLRAAAEVGCDLVEELASEAPLVLPERGALQLQLTVGGPDDDGRRSVAVYARTDEQAAAAGDDGGWTRHAVGIVGRCEEAAAAPAALADLTWPPEGSVPEHVDSFYDELGALGIECGPAFQGVRALWRRGEELFAELELAEEQARDGARFGVHPLLLDAAFQLPLPGAARSSDSPGPRLAESWRRVRVHASGATSLRVRVAPAAGGFAVDAVDAVGAPVLAVAETAVRPVDAERLERARRGPGDGLLRLDWIPLARGSVAAAGDLPAGRWAVVGDAGAAPDALAAGDAPAPAYADLAALLDGGLDQPLDGVIVALDSRAADGEGDGGRAARVAGDALRTLQAFVSDQRLAEARLVVLTREAVAAVPGEGVADLAAAAAWGLLRVAQSEHPDRFSLLDADGSEATALTLPAAVVAAIAGEPQVAVRDGALLVPRLARVDRSALADAAPLDPDGTVLVTGCGDGLGVLAARGVLAESGAQRLLLVGGAEDALDGAAELLGELRASGREVRAETCDLTDREQLATLLASIPDEHPLTAVIHAPVALGDGVLESLDGDRLAAAVAPVVGGALHLHELTRDLSLSRFVLFSGAAATVGHPGRASHAVAGAFLDALAAARVAGGLPATALAWGPWAVSDAEASRPAAAALLGLAPLAQADALDLLGSGLAFDAVVLPVRLDRVALRAAAREGALPAVLRGLAPVSTRRADGSAAGRLAMLPADERAAAVRDLVRSEVAVVLGHETADALDLQLAFKDLGFDSLTSVELRNRLERASGLKLAATLVFDYPTPEAVAGHLLSKVEGLGGVRAGSGVARVGASLDEPVAIVGMSCRYPGGASSPEALWELVASGADAISSFPADRGWDLERLADPDGPGGCYTDQGGFLYEAATDFDAAFFGIAPREALAMDPQQRLLLELAWEALEHAGIDPAALRGSDTGVFAGISAADYSAGAATVDELRGYLGTGTAGSIVSGRVAYTFGLEGPAMTVDTACSSSLVALHLACQALRNGECSMALAGGVTVFSTPMAFLEFSRQRALAADGRCKSFAAAADGTGFSEGAGLLVVERLSDARRNGREILAVVRGSAANQDGASNGLTAPNGPSQERVILRALASAGLSPADVDAVEAHGTGTMLGDPIEAQALLATYGQGRSGAPLRLGSLKSNVGHTQAAAGVGGVMKMVMALRNGVLPKTLHVDQPTPHVDWSSGEIELLVGEQPWAPGERPRRAGVSAFGMSGTNAHVILEEAPAVLADPAPEPDASGEPAAGAQPRPPAALPLLLSAKSEPALRGQAERLAAHLRASGERSDARRRVLAGRAGGARPPRGGGRRRPGGAAGGARWACRGRARGERGRGIGDRGTAGGPVHRPGVAAGRDGARAVCGSSGVRGGVRRGLRGARRRAGGTCRAFGARRRARRGRRRRPAVADGLHPGRPVRAGGGAVPVGRVARRAAGLRRGPFGRRDRRGACGRGDVARRRLHAGRRARPADAGAARRRCDGGRGGRRGRDRREPHGA